LVKKKIPDEDERAVMRQIAHWRLQDQPLSWEQIYDKLRFELQIKNKNGTWWSASRIKRACRVEFSLQSREFQETR
jgi:hypothetical protein